MPTLDWIGKKVALDHHREVPFRLLKTDASLSIGDADCGNLLVQGDNLVALKALLPYRAGQVKCVPIDPPNYTGNESWTYNDAVSGSGASVTRLTVRNRPRSSPRSGSWLETGGAAQADGKRCWWNGWNGGT